MRSRRWDLLSFVPLLALGALVALVGTLVWGVARADAQRAAARLATDALWVEQTLRFQLGVDEDLLVRLALDAAGGTPLETLKARARLHLMASPETLSVQWVDAGGARLASVPEGVTLPDPAFVRGLLARAPARARPVIAPPAGGTVTMALPLGAGGGAGGRAGTGVGTGGGGGAIVAEVSLPIMLERHIPWWIAEQYAVQITARGAPIAARARRPAALGPAPAQAPPPGEAPATPGHAISFDPPLAGAMLEIRAYERPAALGSTALLGAIVGLAAFSVLALLVVQRNAAHRRRAEERLRAEMAFRRAMEESLTVGLRAKDHEGRVLYVNAAFCKLVGLPAEALVGQGPPMPYWCPEAIAETLARQRALAQGAARPQAFETRFRRGDGSEIDVQVFEAPLIDAGGTHRGWMGSVIDITAAKAAARRARAEDESLARTARLVTLGEMASILAHELNQPLSAIASYAAGGLNLLARPGADRAPAPALSPSTLPAAAPDLALIARALEQMQAQARRAGQIIRGIQDFVKKRAPRFQPVPLAEVVEAALALLGPEARERRIVLSADLAPLPPLPADRILLEQVLINLLRNAMEATDGAGAVEVALRGDGAGGAVIEVADRGGGIPEAVRGRLFDPFISSRPEGMGMGLNICRSIAEAHRGQLTHRPRPGGGTIFALALPAAAPAAQEAPAPQETA